MSKQSRSQGPAKRKAPARNSRRTAQGAAADEVLDWRWAELTRSYPGHPALDAPAIYALPPELIDALQTPQQKFFSADEERFERDLARLGGGGFFLKRTISHPLLPQGQLNEMEASRLLQLQERQQHSAQKIRQMLADEMRQAGWSDQEISGYSENEQAIKARIEERQWGYLGWLVTNAGFRQARDVLRERWGEQIAQRGSFLQIPLSWFGERPPDHLIEWLSGKLKRFGFDRFARMLEKSTSIESWLFGAVMATV